MRVAVLGTGIMGTGMAHSLRREGFEVVVWNRSVDKAHAVGDGTVVANTPVEAVQGCDAVFTMLSKFEAVEEVAEQFLPHMGQAVWLQSSTVGLEGTKALARMAGEHNVTFVECPVSGTRQPAETGQVTVIAGGPHLVREAIDPVFDAIGRKTIWVGEDPSAASLTKLVANNWVIGITGLLAETLTFAEASGLDPSAFLNLIEGAPMDSPYAHLKGAMMLDRAYEPSFPLGLAAKDAALIQDAANSAGVSLPISAAVSELYSEANKTHSDKDMSAVFEALQ